MTRKYFAFCAKSYNGTCKARQHRDPSGADAQGDPPGGKARKGSGDRWGADLGKGGRDGRSVSRGDLSVQHKPVCLVRIGVKESAGGGYRKGY